MTVHKRPWDMSDEEHDRLGNVRTLIHLRQQLVGGDILTPIETRLSGWNIENGVLYLQRRIMAVGTDPEAEDAVVMPVNFASYNEHAWSHVEQLEFAFDPDAIVAAQEQQRQAQAAAKLMPPGPQGPMGMPPTAMPPNRQARRHPGR